MKLNMKAPIIGFEGEPLMHTVKQEQRPITLRDVLITALSTPGPRYPEESAEDKFKRGFLSIEAHTKDSIEVSTEDAVLMKRCVAAIYAPVLVYRAHLALDGKDMNPEANKD